MPLISCPSCGKTVSDKAEKCVHCGAKFKTCEKCNSTFVGDGSICDRCLKNDGSSAHEENIDDIDYISDFAKASPKTTRMLDSFDGAAKAFKIIDCVIYFLVILLIAIAASGVVDDFISTYIGNALYIMMITVLIAVYISFHGTKRNVPSYIYTLQCADWIAKNNIQAKRFIERRFSVYLATNDFKAVDTLFDFTAGALYAKDVKAKQKYKTHFLIRAIAGYAFIFYTAFISPFILASFENSDIIIAAIIFGALLILYLALTAAFIFPDSAEVRKLYYPETNKGD